MSPAASGVHRYLHVHTNFLTFTYVYKDLYNYTYIYAYMYIDFYICIRTCKCALMHTQIFLYIEWSSLLGKSAKKLKRRRNRS